MDYIPDIIDGIQQQLLRTAKRKKSENQQWPLQLQSTQRCYRLFSFIFKDRSVLDPLLSTHMTAAMEKRLLKYSTAGF